MKTLKNHWTPCSPSFQSAAEQELLLEVGEGHVLSGIAVHAMARRLDKDDVLFALKDRSERVAVVRLTYSMQQEVDPDWPRTVIYESFKAWLDTPDES